MTADQTGVGSPSPTAPPRFTFGGRAAVALAAALVALYLASRLWLDARLPYFLDEGIFAGFSYDGAQSAHQLFVSLSIGKEPLQAWLGIVWQWLGANPLDAMRLVSISAGLLTVGVVARLGHRVGGKATAGVAAALCVVLPFMAVTDGVGIEEPLVTLLMATALLVQIELAARPSLRRGLLLGVVLAAGVLTKQNAQAALFLLPASLLMFDFGPSGRRERLARWGGAVVIVLILVAGAELALRTSHYWAQGNRLLSHFPLVRTFGAVLSDPFATSGKAWAVYRPALTGYITVPVIIAGALGVVPTWRQDRRLCTLLLVWVVLPFLAALLFTLVPYPRHIMFALPPALVLVARAVVWLFAAAGRARRPAVTRGLAGLLCFAALIPALGLDARVLAHPRIARYPGLDDYQYVTGNPAGGAWPAVAAAIRRHAVGRTVYVFVAEADPNVIRFELSSDPDAASNRYRVVLPGDRLVARSQFAIVDQLPFADEAALRFIATHRFRVLGRFPRPRGGAVVTLYVRSG